MAHATAADVLVDALIDWGVEVIFGLPGDGINGIIEALRQRKEDMADCRPSLARGRYLLFAMWFATGLVMMYVGFPEYTPAERFSRLEPIDWSRIRTTPEKVLHDRALGESDLGTCRPRDRAAGGLAARERSDQPLAVQRAA